jgi:TonB-dependent SusC/RagA subfamily outer membrane receptor
MTSHLLCRRLIPVAIVAALAGCHHGNAATTAAEPAATNGYGARSDSASANAAADRSAMSSADASTLITARFPGVDVQRLANGGYTFVIRGRGSLMGGSDPLIIVDGTQVTGNLSWLNANDIARIDVLKNPDEVAIYGVRGANGVIVISTKRSH